MKPRSKKVGVLGIVLSVVAIGALITADILCARYSSMITLYFRGTSDEEAIQTALEEANEFTEREEQGGLVLLKNENNVLPLSSNTTKVNLFGALSAKQVYMGTGSAGGFNWTSEDFLDLNTAFSEVGISVNEDLWNFYSDLTGDAGAAAGSVTDMQGSTHSIVDVSLDYEGYSAALASAEAYSDTAIVVVGRAGGEGSDAVMDMTPYESGSTTYNAGGDAGKHYLELMDVELELINYVKENYENVILLVNTPMAIELSFVDGEEKEDGTGNIDSVAWIGLPGTTGNRGVVRVLTGEVSPSGRLPDTWAYEVESAPSYYNFGDFTYDFGTTDMSGNSASKYVHYKEGIYVGYRWYETANAEGVKLSDIGNFQYNNTTYSYFDEDQYDNGQPAGAEQKSFDFSDYDSVVQYSFGSGLSYADFDIAFDGTPSYDSGTNEFVFNVKVTNTSSTYTSRTPVEIYVEQPYIASEGIEKSKVVLAQFGKTDEIAPGDSETLELRINRDEIASYDYKTEEAYVLSAGTYTFYVDWGEYGSHCWANTSDTSDVLSWNYTLDSKIVFDDEARDSDEVPATNQFDDVSMGDGAYTPSTDDLTRSDFEGSFPTGYAEAISDNEVNDATKARFVDKVMGAVLEGYDPDSYSYTGDYADSDGSYKDPDGVEALPLSQDSDLLITDLIGVEYDDPLWDELISKMSFSDLQRLIGTCGWSNPAIQSIGKKFAVDMDGCHGLHDLVTGVDANCYTTTPLLTASFDRELAYEMGEKYSAECLANGVTGMYGFSMNMHRSPFGGRNFEYYSEDGFLAGSIAAQQTSGLQDNGVAVYSKHYALNDQETNRSSSHSWASEQTMREIYLRPFEIVTKTATTSSELITGSTGFMASYNWVGTAQSTHHYKLMTYVPRTEWGFQGRIVTDAYAYGDSMSIAVRAGTDMMLTAETTTFDSIDGLDNSSGYGLAAIQQAAKRQLFVFANTAGISTETGASYAWVAIPVVVSIVLAAGAVLSGIFLIYPAFFKKKETEEETKNAETAEPAK